MPMPSTSTSTTHEYEYEDEDEDVARSVASRRLNRADAPACRRTISLYLKDDISNIECRIAIVIEQFSSRMEFLLLFSQVRHGLLSRKGPPTRN